MKTVNVRELFKFRPEELLEGLKTNLKIVYEDGKALELTSREIILNRYLMEILTLVPELAIKSDYSINNYYSNGMYVAKSINKCFESMLENIIVTFIRPINDRSFLVQVFAKMYEVVNRINNEVIYTSITYSASLSIEDFLEIQMKPELLNSLKAVNNLKTNEAVQASYAVLDNIIRTDKNLVNNVIAMGYIAGTINPNQVKQMLASRGFLTEIDSSVFKYPVPFSFALGLNDLYSIAVESRSGAKALFLSNKAIQASEYFAREMQLVSMAVSNLVDGDCGNKEYIDWLVRDDSLTGKADLDNLIGQRYLNEDGKEEVITKKHTHLIGKVIKKRSTMKCKEINKGSICTACFGELSYNVHKHTNIGHISSTTCTSQISQSILSTKHLTSSADADSISLDDTTKKFFSVKNKDGYGFRAAVLGKARSKLVLIVDQNSAFGLKDLSPDEDVRKLNPARVSRIESFILNVEHQDGKVETYPITVKNGSRYGSFTYDFLEYIAEGGYYLDEYDRYIIDLNDWTKTVAILRLPQVEFNFLALATVITSMFKSKMENNRYFKETQESLLQKVFDMINSKLNVNIALLEVIVYAFTVMNENNMDLGRNTKTPTVARIFDIITNRSLGSAYAWEQETKWMFSPTVFNGRNSINHLLDVLYKPEQTLLDLNGSLR